MLMLGYDSRNYHRLPRNIARIYSATSIIDAKLPSIAQALVLVPEMTSIEYKSLVFKLSVIGMVISMMMAFGDIVISSLWEGLHITFEVIEVILDNLVEHIFSTGVHDTQIIVFYLMITIGIGCIFLFSHALVKLYRGTLDTYNQCKIAIDFYWHSISILGKAAWIMGLSIVFILSLMQVGLM